MKSDVYFIKLDSNDPKHRAASLAKLMGEIQSFSKYRKDEIIPIKITIGDSHCIYNLRPEMVKVVVSELKKTKTRPFIFDTNVIYKGERLNAIDHSTLANNKGFGHSKIGAPFIVADGLFGQDGIGYEIKNDCINKVKLPSFIGMLDSLVVLSHITGHILAGYAGAIKNVAMGMSCRSTKQVQHSSLKPHIIRENCTACGCCIERCLVSAISWKADKAFINQDLCIGCGECICACKFNAVFINWDEKNIIFCKRMAEVANFILSKFKNKLFINFAFDITKECDCISAKDEKIITGDLGILASEDPVSVDKATVDLINDKEDLFLKTQGRNEYYKMLEYAAEKGLGNLEYNLRII